MDFLGMKVYLSWYERDDEISILVNCGWSSIFVADNWYLSFVEGQKSPFCPKKRPKDRWGELFGDEPFIHLSVRWPPRQKARSKPTKPHTSDFVGGLILPDWPQFKYLGVNDGGKCHGQFSFFSWRASWEYPLGLHPGWTRILFSQKYGNWKKLARSHGRKQTWELRSQFYAFLFLWRVRIVVECKVMKEKHHKNATAGSNS